MTALIPVQHQDIEETINLNVGLDGYSIHTQRAYRRWIGRYIADVNRLDRRYLALSTLPVNLIVSSLGTAALRVWLGLLKTDNLGQQSLGQARAAIVWIAQFMADLGRLDYSMPAGLSRVKLPRSEGHRRPGTWLTPDEIKTLIRAIPEVEAHNPALVARDTAIIVLLATTGLRRDEVAKMRWCDLARQGGNHVCRVHGKGSKLRLVKLPGMAVRAIAAWKSYHPSPEGYTPVFLRVWRGGKVYQVTTDGLSDKAIYNVLKRIAKAADLPDISPHDLRRSFARGSYEAGASTVLIQQALGHSSIATTERYVNAKLELDWAATDSIGAIIESSECDPQALSAVITVIDALESWQRRALVRAINSRYAAETRIKQ